MTGRPQKLTKEDAFIIRDLHEWKKREIKRINETASAKALAVKFGVSTRAIERVLAYEVHY
jgi:hypothetical protein